MNKEVQLEDLVILYPFVTQLGIDEHLETLKIGGELEPIDVMHCSHDCKDYLEDGAHRCYVYYNHWGKKSTIAKIYLCTDQNSMYGFSNDTCYIRELHKLDRFTIKDFKIEEPDLD